MKLIIWTCAGCEVQWLHYFSSLYLYRNTYVHSHKQIFYYFIWLESSDPAAPIHFTKCIRAIQSKRKANGRHIDYYVISKQKCICHHCGRRTPQAVLNRRTVIEMLHESSDSCGIWCTQRITSTFAFSHNKFTLCMMCVGNCSCHSCYLINGLEAHHTSCCKFFTLCFNVCSHNLFSPMNDDHHWESSPQCLFPVYYSKIPEKKTILQSIRIRIILSPRFSRQQQQI